MNVFAGALRVSYRARRSCRFTVLLYSAKNRRCSLPNLSYSYPAATASTAGDARMTLQRGLFSSYLNIPSTLIAMAGRPRTSSVPAFSIFSPVLVSLLLLSSSSSSM